MAILTLTTDFGEKDFLLATFKGLIYNEISDVNIIDISNEIPVFEIQRASFVLKHAWQRFPEKTLHVCRVGEKLMRNKRYLACEYNGHYFLFPDNGMLTLVLEKYPKTIIGVKNEMEVQNQSSFLSKVIAHILKTDTLEDLGDEALNIQERVNQQPILSNNMIRGTVQYIDRFGNIYTNITKELFDSQFGGRDFDIRLRAVQFNKLYPDFSELQNGSKSCFFNSFGLLQISQAHGNASKLFGLKVGDTVQINFR